MIEYINCETFDQCEYCDQVFEAPQTVYMGWSKCFCSRRCRDKGYKRLKELIAKNVVRRDYFTKM